MSDTPLNPDALEAASRAIDPEAWEVVDKHPGDPGAERLRASLTSEATKQVSAYFAAALPEVTSVDSLLDTRAGLALANEAFAEGLSAGIRACNAAEGDVPFKKPVSPYSAPLLALIKADHPEVPGA